ncbi:MAG: hypothetical protein HUJ30_05950 [Gammaproteobacteria bacterium]|nr:hypothetical protein [Gammaproteobacteria bacterium]
MRYLLIFTLMVFHTLANAGVFADFVGAYLADEDGLCLSEKSSGKTSRYINIFDVCLPKQMVQDVEKRELMILAVTELKYPENLDEMMRRELSKRQVTEAYKVEIDNLEKDEIKLVDGSVFKNVHGGHLGYLGYRKEALIYKDGKQWRMCVNGAPITIEPVVYVNVHYSKSVISDMSVRKIEQMKLCK